MDRLKWWNLKLDHNSESAILQAFREQRLSYGQVGRQLEAELQNILQVKHVLLCTSGSSALTIALKSLGVSAGDEVIVPNRTFIATANAAHLLGAHVKLADVDSTTGTMDVSHVESLLTKKTKVVVPVHLNGRWSDIRALKSLQLKFDFKILEDTAQGFYCKKEERYFGTWGDIGSYSMGVTKFLSAGQGGFIATNNSTYFEVAKRFVLQAQEGIDDKTFPHPGFNFRLPDLLSAIALPQVTNAHIKKEKFLKTYSYYEQELRNNSWLKLLPVDIEHGEVPIWIEILTEYRDELFFHLKNNGIESVKFYPSLHRSPFLQSEHLNFSASNFFEQRGLILPSGPDIDHQQLHRVVKKLHQFRPLGDKHVIS